MPFKSEQDRGGADSLSPVAGSASPITSDEAVLVEQNRDMAEVISVELRQSSKFRSHGCAQR